VEFKEMAFVDQQPPFLVERDASAIEKSAEERLIAGVSK
jgi:hypothetical protein